MRYVIISGLMLLVLLACDAFGATHYCDLSLSANGTGTALDPWQASQAFATPVAGDTVNCRGTKATALSLTASNAKGTAGNVITYQQWAGHTTAVVTGGMTITGPADFYLTFDNIDIFMPDVGSTGSGLTLNNGHHVTYKNSVVTGNWEDLQSNGMTWRGVWVKGTSGSITIQDCSVTNAYFGIVIEGTVDEAITVHGCTIYHVSGPNIQWDPGNDGCAQFTVEDCTLYDQKRAQITLGNWTHGSGISLWHDNCVIQRNVIHDCGNTAGLRTYPDAVSLPAGGYSNLTIQNNLIYDCLNINSVELNELNDNILIRNNTVLGVWRNYDVAWATSAARYYGCCTLDLAAGANWSDGEIEMYGNVIGGEFVCPTTTGLVENYNIFYAWNLGYPSYSRIQDPIGANSLIVAYGTDSLRAGWSKTTLETSGIFFVGDALFDAYTARWPSGTHHGLDFTQAYKLAAGSAAIDFCAGMADPLTVDREGSARDVSPDAGCYEYQAAPPAPTLPDKATNPSPAHAATGQTRTGLTLSWTAGSGATAHHVYFGTDSSPDSTEFKAVQTGTTYSTGRLAWSTTYYWRIDEINAQGTKEGDIWQFRTEAKTRKSAIFRILARFFGGTK